MQDKTGSKGGDGGCLGLLAQASPPCRGRCLFSSWELWSSRAAMLPTEEVAMEMHVLSELVGHFGSHRYGRALWPRWPTALASWLPYQLSTALEQGRIDGRTPLTAIQAAQVGLVWKLARRILRVRGVGDWTSWIEEDVWSTPAPASPATSSKVETRNAAAAKERKMKCNQIIDQGDDSEFLVLPEEKKKMWLQHYIQTMGSLPEEEGKPTLEQLSALRKKISSGLTPFVDLGWTQSTQSFEVSYLDPHGRWMHLQGTSWTSKLLLSSFRDVEGSTRMSSS